MSEKSKRLGRPPIDPDDESVSVTVRMPSKQYDAVYRVAQRTRVTVPEVMRHALRRSLRERESEDE